REPWRGSRPPARPGTSRRRPAPARSSRSRRRPWRARGSRRVRCARRPPGRLRRAPARTGRRLPCSRAAGARVPCPARTPPAPRKALPSTARPAGNASIPIYRIARTSRPRKERRTCGRSPRAAIVEPMPSESQANLLAGEWRPARRGASFSVASGATEVLWPQSDGADVSEAWRAARAASPAWRRLAPGRCQELLLALARELERDEELARVLGARFSLESAELASHFSGLERAMHALFERPASPGEGGIVWCASDWRELLRAPLLDLARECLAGRVLVLVSDARLPELAQHLAQAASAVGFPPGVLGLLHGATRELLQLALSEGGGTSAADRSEGCTLVASGSVERMIELRRLESSCGVESRLRALRCGVHEVDPERALEESAAEVLERAFGRGSTLTGQLPGALGRV